MIYVQTAKRDSMEAIPIASKIEREDIPLYSDKKRNEIDRSFRKEKIERLAMLASQGKPLFGE